MGKLIFNYKLQNNIHLENTESQFLALSPKSKAHDDAPDAVEGAKFIVDNKTMGNVESIIAFKHDFYNDKKF